MDEKSKELAKKLQALADRGVGGEKETAARKLQQLLAKNGVFTIDELLEEDKVEYVLLSYNGKPEEKLLRQCIYKVKGYNGDRETYRTSGTRQKVGVYCTKAQLIEIELEFDFYKELLKREILKFTSAFIRKQNIFPEDAPQATKQDYTEEDLLIGLMMQGIEKKERVAQIEQKAGASK